MIPRKIYQLAVTTTLQDEDVLAVSIDSDKSTKKISWLSLQTLIGIVTGLSWGNIVGTLSAQTDLQAALDAKAPITKRVSSIVSSATPSINIDSYDALTITALATAITSMSSGLSGTPTPLRPLIFRFKDDGTARAITWGASFRASTDLALPTTTVLGKTLYVGFLYNEVSLTWDLLAVLNNF